MNTELKYGGYTANPSDYECPDGDLALSLGLVPEDGALKPVLPPFAVLSLSSGDSVRYIHKTSSYTHYIIYNDGTKNVYYIDAEAKTQQITIDLQQTVTLHHFDAVGNTLLALTNGGIYYFLWQDGAYKSLGNQIPDVEMSFGLVGHPRLFSRVDDSKSTFTVEFDKIENSSITATFSDDNATKITEQIMAKVNKFVAQESVNKGRFCFPFFVRYALRLYDGSLIYHSAPILMNPSTKAAPSVIWTDYDKTDKTYSKATCDIMMVAATLDYRLIINTDASSLKNWTDIIKSIDVFVSKPIYTYDQSGKITRCGGLDDLFTKFIGRLYVPDNRRSDLEDHDKIQATIYDDGDTGMTGRAVLNRYCEWEHNRIYVLYYTPTGTITNPSMTFHLPEFSEEKMAETLQSTSTFYKLRSIDLSEALDGAFAGTSDVLHGKNYKRKDIIVDEEYLQSLTSREVMTDDYLSRDRLHADFSFVYNNRLNLAGLSRKPFAGFLAQSMFAYCEAVPFWTESSGGIHLWVESKNTVSYSIAVYLKENGETYVVRASALSGDPCKMAEYTGRKSSQGCYLFYPNVNAYKMVIYNDSSICYAVDLKAHEFLNGAYALLDYDLDREAQSSVTLPTVSTATKTFPIDISNKIYTSEVNNPFYFPVLGINTVGTGDMLGICAAAKALSEGQFGQFPLYAFTSEGVWALEVSSTGTYSAKQPITRDVVLSPDSITQIDDAVLFATARGIMLISGSTVKCVSDGINSADLFSVTDLPYASNLVSVYNSKASSTGQTTTKEDITPMAFRSFLQGCRMIYDYTNQHIIVYNASAKYAYVLSLKSGMWGMMLSDVVSNVNSYPDALAMTSGGKLVDFSNPTASGVTALVITRPFTLGDRDAFKTINTVIQRGMFGSSEVQQVLYGSNDLAHWHTVWSSVDRIMRGFRGSPYKAFRLALVCSFDKAESIYGCSLSFDPRLTNQLR